MSLALPPALPPSIDLFTLRDVTFSRRCKGRGLLSSESKRVQSVRMALKGLRVVEMAGLAPAPFAGMILAGKVTILLTMYTINFLTSPQILEPL